MKPLITNHVHCNIIKWRNVIPQIPSQPYLVPWSVPYRTSTHTRSLPPLWALTSNVDSPACTVSRSLELDLLKSSISCWGGSGSAGTSRCNLRSVAFFVVPFRMATATFVHGNVALVRARNLLEIPILLRDVFSLTATSTACSVSGSDTSCKHNITRGELNQPSLHHFIKRLELCYQCACVHCCMGRGRIKGFQVCNYFVTAHLLDHKLYNYHPKSTVTLWPQPALGVAK